MPVLQARGGDIAICGACSLRFPRHVLVAWRSRRRLPDACGATVFRTLAWYGLGLLGWLLMVPSWKDAPLSEWTQASAFDTARDCEVARDKMQAARAAQYPAKLPTTSDLLFNLNEARCVPSESVYPPARSPAPAP